MKKAQSIAAMVTSNGVSLMVSGQYKEDFERLLQRGLNTWDQPPKWLVELADAIYAENRKAVPQPRPVQSR